MTHRTVSEVMTADVVFAREETPFKELAALMAARGVSALPVLGEGDRVAGVVSEADLLAKEEAGEDPHARRLPWRRRRAERFKSAGVAAADVMSRPAVTIGPQASVVAAARELDRHRIKRMPVVDGQGRLAGIVSRRDLLRVFLRPDQEIAREVADEVLGASLGTNPALVSVTVAEGVVTLAGEVERRSMIAPAIRMTQSVEGVVAVTGRLTFAVDDGPRPVTGPPETIDPMSPHNPYLSPSQGGDRSA